MQSLFYKVTIRRMQRKICKRLTTSQVADSQIRKTYSWRQRELFPRAPILNMEHRIYKLPSSSSWWNYLAGLKASLKTIER